MACVRGAIDVPAEISLGYAADLYCVCGGSLLGSYIRLLAFGIGPGDGVVVHPDDGSHIECTVEARVASSDESVAECAPPMMLRGIEPRQSREGGLGTYAAQMRLGLINHGGGHGFDF